MIRVLIITLSVFICSCASIPLSTMLEFSSFNKGDFLSIDPEEIRAKIQVNDPTKVNTDTVRMTLELDTSKGTVLKKFPLVLLANNNIPPDDGLFFSSPGKSEYILELSDKAVENFKSTQLIMSNKESGKFTFAVNSGLQQVPDSAKKVVLSIYLKLSAERGYVALFEDAELEIE
ncbi:hypothetical protein [Idiomarina sp. HP20-50]|uniref:hypothetical protein n=1 Tax=Idiomarina sp. HP20-50 TaxID=3070813 RepID=UPI00294ADE9D|nr:hypothetical protein [Idiomarina sp. HP20-50]MDV6315322.1 hypothetical protein [Idiomarina sp. HP20-50]